MSRDGIWLTLTYAVRVQILFRPLVSSGSPTRQRGRNSKPMSTETSGTTDAEDSTDKQAAIETELEDILDAIEGEDPVAVFEDPYLTRAAMMKNGGESDYQRVLAAVKDSDMNSNEYRSVVGERAEEIQSDPSNSESCEVCDPPILNAPDGDVPTVDDVLTEVENSIGSEARRVAEICLSSTATMLIDGVGTWPGVIVEGASGCGKTTLITSIYPSAMELTNHAHEVTPASFLSADSSRDSTEVQEGSLIRRSNGKVLVLPEMARLFSGGEDRVRDTMSTFAGVMDGGTYARETGTHDRQEVGPVRAGIIGATTPIPPSGWRAMGKTGNRFLLAEYPSDTSLSGSDGEATEIIRGPEYEQTKQQVRDVAVPFVQGLWDEHGGFEGVDGSSFAIPEWVDGYIDYLGGLVAHGRATIGENGGVRREKAKRVKSMLFNLVRGRALLDGRTQIERSDLEVAAYAALSTIPASRRPLIRELVREGRPELDAGDVATLLDCTRPTARERMKDMPSLGIGGMFTESVRGGEQLFVKAADGFEWPDGLPFPDM